ncbi:MAG: hypothetical protein HN348_03950 [Proteobacteria bacterium]|jgi:hypothetical protein|nr:hypothetical protein [Pseudomonadota bacterium]
MRYFLLLFFACQFGHTLKDTVVDTDTDTDVDADTDTDTDTDDPGTDKDGDGFTVEEGDCDDDDIWVNPGWKEDTTDNKDNDCDGRIDEVWAGLLVADVDRVGEPGKGRLRSIDTVGDEKSMVPIAGDASPYWMAEKSTMDGWVAWDVYNSALYEIDNDGSSQHIATIDVEELAMEEDSFLTGIAHHPDDYYLLCGWERLIKVERTGTVSTIATWGEAIDADFEFGAYDVVIDRMTARVSLIGYFGGVASWDEKAGFQVILADDPLAPTHYLWDATIDDSGEVYALGADASGLGIFHLNSAVPEYELVGSWPYGEHSLDGLAVESETGDFYVTMHVGWSQGVWRMLADGSYAAELFGTGFDDDSRRFSTLGILWDQK